MTTPAQRRTSSVRVPRQKMTAVKSGNRSIVNGRTVISVPAKISGFKAAAKSKAK